MWSLYRFHAYYQIRRILAEIKAPLPSDRTWDATDNQYDGRAYERICNEFGVSPNSDWRVMGPTWGLGNVYHTVYDLHLRKGYGRIIDGLEYNSESMVFEHKEEEMLSTIHISFIKQDTPEHLGAHLSSTGLRGLPRRGL